MAQQYSIDQAQNNLDAIIHDVEQGTPVEIIRSGKRVAILISGEDYDRLIKQQPDFWEAVQTFRREFNLGEIGIDSETFAGLRDPSLGREVSL
jgi:prevent-host-death family protein